MQGLQSSIWSNQLKTWFLVLLLPVLLGLGVFSVFYFLPKSQVSYDDEGNPMYTQFSQQERFAEAQVATGEVLLILVPILAIWLLISFFFQRQLMFAFS